MNREIKFRAMVDDMSPRWVYGSLLYAGSTPRIQEMSLFDLFTTCLKGSEGQYTGLKDKNGREIYEGDLIREVYEASGTMPCATFAIPVIFEDASFCLDDHTPLHELIYMKDHDWCVIGNIHENPELIAR